MPPVVHFDVPVEGVLVLTLNRPEARNAVDEAVMARLELALDRIERDPDVRAVVLTGKGNRAFCAGGDLKYFETLQTAEQARAMSRRMQRILTRFWLGDRAVIAAVNGAAIGGGFEIVTAAHFRICTEDATFRFVQVRRGLVTGWGGTARLFRMIGRDRALELLLTARKLNAREAEDRNIVNRVVPGDRLMPEALALAAEIAEGSPAAIRGFLEMAAGYEEPWLRRALKKETELFGERWSASELRTVLDGVSDRTERSRFTGDPMT